MTSKSGGKSAQARPQSAEMTGGPGFRARREIVRPPADLTTALGAFNAADISDALNRMYVMDAGVKHLSGPANLAGPAVTVKVFPGDNLMLHKALDVIQPGDVIVVDTSGSDRNAVMGDMVAHKAKHRGAAGFIVDGLIRDLEGVGETGLPVFARGVTAFGPLHRGPGELNYPVSCGGIVVNPGDIIVGDADGVVAIRAEFAERALAALTAHKRRTENYVANVKRGEFSNDWVDRLLEDGGCQIE